MPVGRDWPRHQIEGSALDSAVRIGLGQWDDLSRRLVPCLADETVDAVGQLAISLVGCVLVAQRCVLGRVTESTHDLLGARPGGGGERAGDVAEVVESHLRESDGVASTDPLAVPDPSANRSALLTDEQQRFRRRPDPLIEVRLQNTDDLGRDGECASPGLGLRRTDELLAALRLGLSKDTAARAVARLARAGVVRRVAARRGAGGALPTSLYIVDVDALTGVTVSDIETASRERAGPNPTTTVPSSDRDPSPRRAPRASRRVDDAQSSLFDLPAGVS